MYRSADLPNEVHVHPARDKCLRYIDNIDDYDKIIKQRALDKAPPDDLVNLFNLADQAGRSDWKNRAATILTEHVDRLVQESEDTDFILDFGQSLLSPKLKEYDKALRLFSQLVDKSSVNQSVRNKATICQAEILLTYFARNDEALKILNELPNFKLHPALQDVLRN